MDNMEDATVRLTELQQRLQDKGVVDVKFFKTEEFTKAAPLRRAIEIINILEAVLDGRTTPAAPFGDSVRSPNTLSPAARCGGGRNGDQYEINETSGTATP